MKSKFGFIAVLLALLFLPACAGQATSLNVSNVGGLIDDLCNRHDEMLNGTLDPKTISVEDKASYLRSSNILRQTVQQARVNAGLVPGATTPSNPPTTAPPGN